MNLLQHGLGTCLLEKILQQLPRQLKLNQAPDSHLLGLLKHRCRQLLQLLPDLLLQRSSSTADLLPWRCWHALRNLCQVGKHASLVNVNESHLHPQSGAVLAHTMMRVGQLGYWTAKHGVAAVYRADQLLLSLQGRPSWYSN